MEEDREVQPVAEEMSEEVTLVAERDPPLSRNWPGEVTCMSQYLMNNEGCFRTCKDYNSTI